jgi:hypothetical protein
MRALCRTAANDPTRGMTPSVCRDGQNSLGHHGSTATSAMSESNYRGAVSAASGLREATRVPASQQPLRFVRHAETTARSARANMVLIPSAYLYFRRS